MHEYDLAQLNEEQVRQLNKYQEKLSEQLGQDIILIAYHDGEESI